jgi:hypothetical protein
MPGSAPHDPRGFIHRLGAQTPPDATWLWYLLPRQGVRPLGFFGRLILQRTVPAEAPLRLRLFEIAGGGAAASLQAVLPGRSPWRHAMAAATPAVLAAQLRALRPAALPLSPGATAPDCGAAWRQILRAIAPIP